MKKFLVLVFSLSLFLGLNGCGNSANDPEKVAISFFQNLANDKVDLAIELLDFSELKDDEAKMAKDKMRYIFSGAAQELKKEGKDLKKVVSKGVKYSDDKKKATVTLAISEDETEDVELVKVNKEWKIVLR
ncbi:MAG: DUF4878 domain-containing protein [Campylobacteraceae bacterium]|jgi:hypothetical protein|nr:DUF4878 domain-containing protein [Campylobacteraceae bacterium]